MFNRPYDKIATQKIMSARAVTGRPCPHSGEGEDFLTHQPGFFFTKMAVAREQKVENGS